MKEILDAKAAANASLIAGAILTEGGRAAGRYSAKCYENQAAMDRGDAPIWDTIADNVVTTLGGNLALDTLLAGSSYTTTGPYMGLISSVSWTNLATTISSGTYTTGAVSLVTSGSHGLSPGDSFTIASATGTGSFAALNGTFKAIAGTTGTTLTFSIVSGLTMTITGGNVTTASGTRITDTMASHGNWTEAGGANAPTFSVRLTPSFSSAATATNGGSSKTTSAAVNFTMTGAGTLEGVFLVTGSGAVATIGNTSGTLLSAGAFSGGAQAVQSGNVVAVTYSLSI